MPRRRTLRVPIRHYGHSANPPHVHCLLEKGAADEKAPLAVLVSFAFRSGGHPVARSASEHGPVGGAGFGVKYADLVAVAQDRHQLISAVLTELLVEAVLAVGEAELYAEGVRVADIQVSLCAGGDSDLELLPGPLGNDVAKLSTRRLKPKCFTIRANGFGGRGGLSYMAAPPVPGLPRPPRRCRGPWERSPCQGAA